MPTIHQIIKEIEDFAPPIYQEGYDNAGLITGQKSWTCSGVLLSLDCIESVVEEAIENNCNLIIAHHPIVFKGLKSLTGKNYVERTIIKAIKHDIAIYACHTNLDNMSNGVNAKIAQKLGLINTSVLSPKQNTLLRLITFVPIQQAETVREAIFTAGAGDIGNYSQCSFNTTGDGTFFGNDLSNPKKGEKNTFELVDETKIEVLVPAHLQYSVLQALKMAHSYEEVPYYFIPLINENQEIGSGLIGEFSEPIAEKEFLNLLKTTFKSKGVRHTNFIDRPIKKVALCGGAGSFLLQHAIKSGADAFISADFKYHEFFDADGHLLLADIGHYESEQFTPEIFYEIITKKYSNFAVHFSTIDTNPIKYL